MNLPTDIDLAGYDLQGKTVEELAQQQAALLSLFEQWEDAFTTLRNENKKWKSMGEVKRAIGTMRLIESLWKESKKVGARVNGNPYEDMSILQYRTMLFMQQRKRYRNELANGSMDGNESRAQPPTQLVPHVASLVVEEKLPSQPCLPPRKGKEKSGKTTQVDLDSFFPR